MLPEGTLRSALACALGLLLIGAGIMSAED